jgi:hypothetical protein
VYEGEQPPTYAVVAARATTAPVVDSPGRKALVGLDMEERAHPAFRSHRHLHPGASTSPLITCVFCVHLALQGIEKFGMQSVQIVFGMREKSTRSAEKLCRSSQ